MDNDSPERTERIRTAVFVQRLLVGGLAAGALALGVLIPVLHFAFLNAKPMMADPPQVAGLPVLTLFAGVVACGSAAASFVVGTTVRRQVVDRLAAARPSAGAEDVPTLVTAYQADTLVQAGLCEGPIMLSLTLFLVTGDLALLGVAAAMLVLLVSRFPREASAREWLDRAEEELEAKRAGG